MTARGDAATILRQVREPNVGQNIANVSGRNNQLDEEIDTSNFSLTRLFSELFLSYKNMLLTAPLATKSITSATIAILGEIFGSYITSLAQKRPFKLDLKRLRAFGLYGLLVTGPVLHWWYSLLENTLVRLNIHGRAKSLAKLLLDRILFAPPFIMLTITFLQYFQHFNMQRSIEFVKTSYSNVFARNQQVWVIAQAINFELIPVNYQVLFVNAVSIGWNTLLSLCT